VRCRLGGGCTWRRPWQAQGARNSTRSQRDRERAHSHKSEWSSVSPAVPDLDLLCVELFARWGVPRTVCWVVASRGAAS
jgi:hypothetical protein